MKPTILPLMLLILLPAFLAEAQSADPSIALKLSVQSADATATVSWNASPANSYYKLQWSTDLLPGHWKTLVGALATNSYVDDATLPARFYRLLSVSNLVALTATATNTTAQIGAADILQITLEGNASTGFIWDFAPDTNSVIRLAGEPRYVAGVGVGAPGNTIFQFEPVGPGQSPLKLIYHRRFDPPTTPPEKTFEMTAVVKP